MGTSQPFSKAQADWLPCFAGEMPQGLADESLLKQLR